MFVRTGVGTCNGETGTHLGIRGSRNHHQLPGYPYTVHSFFTHHFCVRETHETHETHELASRPNIHSSRRSRHFGDQSRAQPSSSRKAEGHEIDRVFEGIERRTIRTHLASLCGTLDILTPHVPRRRVSIEQS